MRFRLALLAALMAAVTAFPQSSAARDATKTVVALGDVACAPGEAVTDTRCRQDQVAALTRSLAPEQLWLAGDLQYSIGAGEAFSGSFDSAFGEFRSIWRPVPGNHEYYTPGATGYYGYFGRSAGDPRRGYYSFDAGAWHVVALNSNCDDVPCGYGSAQLRWLARDLKANPNRCVAAIWHHPRYSSGKHGDDPRMRPFWRTLVKARAELAITGHDHHFEAFLPQDENGVLRPRSGLRQFVIGTGGRSLYSTPGSANNSQALVQDHFGALVLKLRPGDWSWRFASESGLTLASGDGRCR
ncbi:MAG: metallophosphoesterase [Actinobacteria bacterium]|nr:metallophosphoesterase [Actinomycetota bacterium]